MNANPFIVLFAEVMLPLDTNGNSRTKYVFVRLFFYSVPTLSPIGHNVYLWGLTLGIKGFAGLHIYPKIDCLSDKRLQT